MKEKLLRAIDFISTIVYGCFAVLFIGVLITSIGKNVIDICVRMGVTWKADVNYFGLFAGFGAYLIYFILYLIIPKIKHNLTWFMKFTHELTHTLVALLFFAKIHKFIVMERECDVYYESKVGYVPITLSPYCIPIYTFMLFPFRRRPRPSLVSKQAKGQKSAGSKPQNTVYLARRSAFLPQPHRSALHLFSQAAQAASLFPGIILSQNPR